MFRLFETETTLDLAPGAVTWHHARRGTELMLTAGHARLHEPPLWLAERLLQPAQLLEPGVPHRLERGGWLRLEALGAPARVQLRAGRWRITGVPSSRPITERAYR